MNLHVFSVKDRASDAFGVPMFMAHVGLAIRSFTDEVNREDSANQLYQHSDDFDLYELGMFDTDSGEFDCFVPRLLTRGKDVSLKMSGAN